MAAELVGRVERLWCCDLSDRMIERAQVALGPRNDIRWIHMRSVPELPLAFSMVFDFVYAFDVFNHMDLHLLHRYLRQVSQSVCLFSVTQSIHQSVTHSRRSSPLSPSSPSSSLSSLPYPHLLPPPYPLTPTLTPSTL